MPVRLIHNGRALTGSINRRGLLSYNATNNEFELKDAKEVEASLLESHLDDNDISDTFVDFLNQTINVDNVEIRGFDGGTF